MRSLTPEQITLLRLLSDGKAHTYTDVVKAFNMPLTPTSPTFTNKLAKPLLKAKLIKRTLGGGLKITDAGRRALGN